MNIVLGKLRTLQFEIFDCQKTRRVEAKKKAKMTVRL